MKSFPINEGVPGFLFAGISAGIKEKGLKDLGLIIGESTCTAAGVFTKNRVKAAPVTVCRRRVAKGVIRSVLVNSGNANACTGTSGIEAARAACSAVASEIGVRDTLVAPCSTGVIGVPLPDSTIVQAVPRLVHAAAPGNIPDFAEAILTTDTCTKIVPLREQVAGDTIKVCGVAKGSGMIMPDMATMLAFVAVGVPVDAALLKKLLKTHVETTFNRISVDGDMSTNDCVLLLASGMPGKTVTSFRSKAGRVLDEMIHETMSRLARMIVVDGEGATKLITVNVVNAASRSDALKAARQVANSCLVKTAFFGEDYNWGRILGALGSSGARFEMERVALFFNGIQGVRNGQALTQHLKKLHKTVTKKEIELRIDLNAGTQSCTYTTCDLSYEYIKINADYTT